jgi:hypothetical protein
MGNGVEEVGGEKGGDKVPVIDKGEGEIRWKPTEVMVLLVSSIEQIGGSSKNVTSFNLIRK